MYILARITIILVSHCILVKASKSVAKAFTVSTNFPSRLYLPTSQNPEPKNRARTSDIEAVLENDLQVIPLAADHDQRNGFQYQPIISRQYSLGSTESPRYLQSAVPNLLQTVNTGELGSPISDANEVKPITKSHLSRETVGYSSTPKRNNPSQDIRRAGSFWCLRKFQSQENSQAPFELVRTENSLRRKILTVNDQENDDTHPERIRLQLTHPWIGISRTSAGHRIDKLSPLASSSTKSSAACSGPWSKENTLIGEPSALYSGQEIKPVFESNEHGTGYDNYNNPYDYNERDYQLGNHNIPVSTSGSLKRPVPSSNIGAGITCSDILGRFLLQTYAQGYNYGYNNHQHLPTDPILALLLSHYGKYLPALRGPRLYSYMAVNNIHNNKPFGSYKLTGDYDSSFVP